MQDNDFTNWGKSVLEEVLLGAALQITNPGQPLVGAEFNLRFDITADPSSNSLRVRCARVDGTELSIEVAIPAGEKV